MAPHERGARRRITEIRELVRGLTDELDGANGGSVREGYQTVQRAVGRGWDLGVESCRAQYDAQVRQLQERVEELQEELRSETRRANDAAALADYATRTLRAAKARLARSIDSIESGEITGRLPIPREEPE